jgi:hypothetical protein
VRISGNLREKKQKGLRNKNARGAKMEEEENNC